MSGMSGITKTGAVSGRRAGVAVPARREATMWRLLIWAFKTECVLAVVGRDDERFMSASGDSASLIANAMELGFHIPGPTVTGGLEVHEDALTLYSVIAEMFNGPEGWLLMDAACKGELPDWDPDLPDIQVRPRIDTSRRKAKPEVWYRDRASSRPFYCPIVYSGYTEAEKDAERGEARRQYIRIVSNMALLKYRLQSTCFNGLTKWAVSGLGVEVQPWQSGSLNLTSQGHRFKALHNQP